MSDQQTNKIYLMPLWAKALLIGSLGLNLVIIGLLVGSVFRAPGLVNPNGSAPGLRPLIEALPQQSAERLRTDIRHSTQREGTDRRARLQIALSIREALLQEPMDRAALNAALTAERDRFFQNSDVVREALLDELQAMSLEDRQALLQRVRQQRTRSDHRN